MVSSENSYWVPPRSYTYIVIRRTNAIVFAAERCDHFFTFSSEKVLDLCKM